MIVTPPGISGFEVMDENIRIIVLEGPAVDVHRIFECVSAAAGHDPQLELLINTELFVPKRAYAVFPPLITAQKTLETTALPKPVLEEKACFQEPTVADNHEVSAFAQENVGSLAADISLSAPLSLNTSGEPAEEVFDTAVAEADGTGGRVHRIRIRETIESLASQQRYLLKRMLSESCVSCYTKLHALCKCSSLREVLERDLFPTPEELISLERSFGMTLELSDIFGRQEFVSITAPNNLDTSFEKKADEVDSTCMSTGVCLDKLRTEDVGKIVLFEATRVLFPGRRVPESVQRRYPNACWMCQSGDRKNLLCIFSNGSQPGGTIRYFIEAQIIRCEQMLCFYALKFSSLAKSCTDSHNPQYRAHLLATRRQRACLRPARSAPRTERRVPDSALPASVHGGNLLVDGCSSESDCSVGTFPCEAHVKPCSVVCEGEKNFITENIKKIGQLSKNVSRMTAVNYELCWDLYQRRAPPATQHKPFKGPPMQF